MVAPLRPLITPWIWLLWATAVPASSRIAASEAVANNVILRILVSLMTVFLSIDNYI
jgi:hypothetical protein